MSEKRSIFFDEWQACLRAHYKFVIQDNDRVTEPTLRGVLLQTGLTDDELHALADAARAETLLDDGAEVVAEAESEAESAAISGEDDPPAGENSDEPANGQMALF